MQRAQQDLLSSGKATRMIRQPHSASGLPRAMRYTLGFISSRKVIVALMVILATMAGFVGCRVGVLASERWPADLSAEQHIVMASLAGEVEGYSPYVIVRILEGDFFLGGDTWKGHKVERETTDRPSKAEEILARWRDRVVFKTIFKYRGTGRDGRWEPVQRSKWVDGEWQELPVPPTRRIERHWYGETTYVEDDPSYSNGLGLYKSFKELEWELHCAFIGAASGALAACLCLVVIMRWRPRCAAKADVKAT